MSSGSPAWLMGRRVNTTGRGWRRELRRLMTCHPAPFPDFISLILSLIDACQECMLWERLSKTCLEIKIHLC